MLAATLPLVLLPPISLPTTPSETPTFGPPTPLEANGRVIDVGSDIGHAGPLFVDFDGDGLGDLLVSSFRGNIRVFKNVGTAGDPVYEEQGNKAYQQPEGAVVKNLLTLSSQ